VQKSQHQLYDFIHKYNLDGSEIIKIWIGLQDFISEEFYGAEAAPTQPDCVNLETFSYALVEVDSRAQPKEMTITVKDKDGVAVKDLLFPALERDCSITIQAE